jgi:hypothetical protein
MVDVRGMGMSMLHIRMLMDMRVLLFFHSFRVVVPVMEVVMTVPVFVDDVRMIVPVGMRLGEQEPPPEDHQGKGSDELEVRE